MIPTTIVRPAPKGPPGVKRSPKTMPLKQPPGQRNDDSDSSDDAPVRAVRSPARKSPASKGIPPNKGPVAKKMIPQGKKMPPPGAGKTFPGKTIGKQPMAPPATHQPPEEQRDPPVVEQQSRSLASIPPASGGEPAYATTSARAADPPPLALDPPANDTNDVEPDRSDTPGTGGDSLAGTARSNDSSAAPKPAPAAAAPAKGVPPKRVPQRADPESPDRADSVNSSQFASPQSQQDASPPASTTANQQEPTPAETTANTAAPTEAPSAPPAQQPVQQPAQQPQPEEEDPAQRRWRLQQEAAARLDAQLDAEANNTTASDSNNNNKPVTSAPPNAEPTPASYPTQKEPAPVSPPSNAQPTRVEPAVSLPPSEAQVVVMEPSTPPHHPARPNGVTYSPPQPAPQQAPGAHDLHFVPQDERGLTDEELLSLRRRRIAEVEEELAQLRVTHQQHLNAYIRTSSPERDRLEGSGSMYATPVRTGSSIMMEPLTPMGLAAPAVPPSSPAYPSDPVVGGMSPIPYSSGVETPVRPLAAIGAASSPLVPPQPPTSPMAGVRRSESPEVYQTKVRIQAIEEELATLRSRRAAQEAAAMREQTRVTMINALSPGPDIGPRGIRTPVSLGNSFAGASVTSASRVDPYMDMHTPNESFRGTSPIGGGRLHLDDVANASDTLATRLGPVHTSPSTTPYTRAAVPPPSPVTPANVPRWSPAMSPAPSYDYGSPTTPTGRMGPLAPSNTPLMQVGTGAGHGRYTPGPVMGSNAAALDAALGKLRTPSGY